MNQISRMVVIFLAIFVQYGAIHANSITTLDIAQKTVEAFPNCSKYKITGMCFWLKCSWRGCYVNSTLKVSHYTPDAVVTTFDNVGDNPWLEADIAYDRASYPVGNRIQRLATRINMGGGDQFESSPRDSTLRKKEVDIIGHPLSRIWPRHLFIRSKATPFRPYFLSMLDSFSWRMGIESIYPQSFMVPKYTLGKFPFSIWGTVYPRDGVVDSLNDAKAGSVIAFRAAHIVTRERQAHVYNRLHSGSCGTKCKVHEVSHDNDNHHWQMLSPIAETQCHAIAHNDATQVREWGLKESDISNGAYAWNLWRKYEGCIPGSGKFLFDISG